MNNDLNKKIESYLFWKGEPVSFKELNKNFELNDAELKENLNLILERYQESGLTLKFTDNSVALTTNSETSDFIHQLIKEDLNKDLTKAALETLSIIIYRGPIKKAEIDFIRGVSSQFILRNLQIRGLIERIEDPNDNRSYLYKSSIDLLNYLGLNNITNMPEYDNVNQEIQSFIDYESENNSTDK